MTFGELSEICESYLTQGKQTIWLGYPERYCIGDKARLMDSYPRSPLGVIVYCSSNQGTTLEFDVVEVLGWIEQERNANFFKQTLERAKVEAGKVAVNSRLLRLIDDLNRFSGWNSSSEFSGWD